MSQSRLGLSLTRISTPSSGTKQATRLSSVDQRGNDVHSSHLELHVLGHECPEAHEGEDEEEVGEKVAHEELVPHESHDGGAETLDDLLKLVAASSCKVRVQGLLFVPPCGVGILKFGQDVCDSL